MKRIVLLFIATAVLLAGCSTGAGQDNSNEAPASAQTAKPVYIMAGKVDANKKADISSKIPAKVTEIMVDVGTAVKKGDPIIKLDTRDIEAQVAQSEAAVNTARANLDKAQNGARSEQMVQAQASYENAKNTYDRNKELYDQGGISKQQLEAAELQYLNAKEQLSILSKDSPESIKVFQSQLSQAQAALDYAKTQLNNGTILSPIDGIVSAKNINIGELAPAGVVVVSIINTEALYINAYLPADLISRVTPGQQATVKVSEVPEKEFQGEIAMINSVIDSRSKNVLVKVNLKDPDSLLRPGMFAQIGLVK